MKLRRDKLLAAFVLVLLSSLSLYAEESITIDATLDNGEWFLNNTELVQRSGRAELQLKTAENRGVSDLYLSFDADKPEDANKKWTVAVKGQYYKTEDARFGSGAASFRAPLTGLTISPGSSAAFVPNQAMGDLSLEFWLKPTRADSGEIVFLWKASRQIGKTSRAQQISCLVLGGKLVFGFIDFFSPPSGAPYTVSLQGTRPLIPGTWSHHLVRFDSNTGLLEYLMNGEVEAISYVSSTGRQAGDIYVPVPGASGRLELGNNYTGLIDEFRISPAFIEEAITHRYNAEGGTALSPILDLGYSNSSILAFNAKTQLTAEAAIHWSYRSADSAAGWTDTYPEWIPFSPGSLKTPSKGRYLQLRLDLYPDAGRENSPRFSSITVKYEADRAPGPPQAVTATAGDRRINVRWKKISESDIAGYMVYYGKAPGDYFGTGAKEGPSPIIVADRDASGFVLNGLNNGTLYFISVAAYDSAVPPHIGEQSKEASARPIRTSP